ncbi:MAG: hypothetical protein LBO70_08450 [Clostridiales Family XIII bacterium]|jgi:hypothetical protein|nr:hypothetical protein [Clostridiales Family XIII bacterium]
MSKSHTELTDILERGDGILNLTPTWVPRPFNRSGNRLRLHTDDTYAMGMKRGAIVERWFSSITRVETEGASAHEGMSFVNVDGDPTHAVLFEDFVTGLGPELYGGALHGRYGTWPMYSKFYDYNEPLFHHVHHSPEACAKVGVTPKHEHYFFPKQYNNHLGTRPTTFFGFDPSVTRDEVKARLARHEEENTKILELSRAFQVELGTGWYTPAGVVHAPGSLCTYEPQWNSDVMALWENVVGSGEIFGRDWLYGYLPEGHEDDLDAVLDAIDWELNTIANYRETYFRPNVPEQSGDGWKQQWICYGNEYVAAKELTVAPGATANVSDMTAYGCLVVQGHGRIGPLAAESPTLIRYGQLTADEFFVSYGRANGGVTVVNESQVEPLVILKHFAAHESGAPTVSPLQK